LRSAADSRSIRFFCRQHPIMMGGSKMISKGETAPSFSGELADGSMLRSDDYRGERNLIVYFFPKDFTPG
jgi:hypothetical protein